MRLALLFARRLTELLLLLWLVPGGGLVFLASSLGREGSGSSPAVRDWIIAGAVLIAAYALLLILSRRFPLDTGSAANRRLAALVIPAVLLTVLAVALLV